MLWPSLAIMWPSLFMAVIAKYRQNSVVWVRVSKVADFWSRAFSPRGTTTGTCSSYCTTTVSWSWTIVSLAGWSIPGRGRSRRLTGGCTELWPRPRCTTVARSDHSIGTVRSRLNNFCKSRLDATIVKTVHHLSGIRISEIAFVEEAAGPVGRSRPVEVPAPDCRNLVLEGSSGWRVCCGSGVRSVNGTEVAVIVAWLVNRSFLQHIGSGRRPSVQRHLALIVDRGFIQCHPGDIQDGRRHRWTAPLDVLRAAGCGWSCSSGGTPGGGHRPAAGLPQGVSTNQLLLVAFTWLECRQDEERNYDETENTGRYYNEDDDWQPDHAHINVWICQQNRRYRQLL